MDSEAIVAVFPSRVILTKALDRVMELDYLTVRHAAIIAKARDGEVVILDDDISPDEGSIAGGTLGAAMTAFGLVQMGALTSAGNRADYRPGDRTGGRGYPGRCGGPGGR